MNAERRRSALPRALSRGAALFLVLCGLLLMAAGRSRDGDAAPVEDAEEQARAAALGEALSHLRSAREALREKNYGAAERHVHHVELTLSEAIGGGRDPSVAFTESTQPQSSRR